MSIQKEDKKPAQRYDFAEREVFWQKYWEKEDTYRFDGKSDKPVFSIDTPPPTVSGALHLGHIYSYTQAEVVARYHRMAGYDVFYPFGLDNNGLPTERLVEKELGIRGKDMVLADFIKSCESINEKYKTLYENLWKSIGLSVAWDYEYTTISEPVQKMAQSTFKSFFDKNIVYKKNTPAIFCTECLTAVAQAEVEDKELNSVFYDLKFHLEDGTEFTVATTRPELLPACVAVFVNPDGKHKEMIGKTAVTPLNDKVTILGDDKVEESKGSGIVMCCTYGDETDVYWVKVHELPEKIIFTDEGRIKDGVLPELTGLRIKQARNAIVESLRNNGFITKETPIVHAVGVHERCGTPVEFIPTSQWYLKILDIKEDLKKRGEEVKWHPAFMQKRYLEWVEGLKWDWCISRERFFGICIPVYYCQDCGKTFVPDESVFPIDTRTHKEACPFCESKNTIGEKDVFDTWFTSSQTPELAQMIISKENPDIDILPMSMRPQAHDIIRTWALYTIVMSHYLKNSIPWKELMISGHILLKSGEKISKKSGGGPVKPEELISTHSADAIRYAMCGASLGNDGFFDVAEVEKGKKLINKFYNAGKLVFSLIDPNEKPTSDSLTDTVDRWIVARSEEVALQMAKEFEKYQYANARRIFEDFFWREFCDNYLEIAKARLNAKENLSAALVKSTQYALYTVLLNTLKEAAPFVPHITEEMYHAEAEGEGWDVTLDVGTDQGIYYRGEGEQSLHVSSWPKAQVKLTAEESSSVELLLEAVGQVRKYKAANQLSQGTILANVYLKTDNEKQKLLLPLLENLKLVCRIENLRLNASSEDEILIDL
jgi:valyl-tRNA synthetase